MKQARTPILHTQRLQMHSLSDSDLHDLIALFTNREVSKTYMVPVLPTTEDAERLFSIIQQQSESLEHFVYGVYLNGKLIGFLNDVDSSETEMELGYAIHPEYQNRGFATEVLSAAIRELGRLGYEIVKAGAFEENKASMHVMEKCGMVRSPDDDDISYRGQMHHCINYTLKLDR